MARINKFVGMLDSIVKECRTTILIKTMDLARMMFVLRRLMWKISKRRKEIVRGPNWYLQILTTRV